MTDEERMVRKLLERETEDEVPEDHARRVREGLGALLAAHPPTTQLSKLEKPAASPERVGESAATTSALGRWVAPIAIAVGAAAAGFAVGRTTAPQAASPSSVASTSSPATTLAPATSPVVAAREAQPAPASSAAPIATVGGASSTSSNGPAAAQPTDAFNREQSLLERARSALVRHDADAAEHALEQCDRDFPRSRYMEEREYLRIQVLRERGDKERTRESARKFLAKYPDSLLRGRVEPLTQ